MPAYPGNALATLLRTNQYAFLWQNEIVPAGVFPGSLSVSFEIERISRSAYPWGCSFEATFASSPGSFEIDIMGANTDNAPNYVLLGSISTATSIVPGFFTGRYDMATNLWPKYVAAYMKTLGNAVAVTLQVSR